MKEKVSVTGVPETMIQTLYARAKESQKDNPMIQDDMAAEIYRPAIIRHSFLLDKRERIRPRLVSTSGYPPTMVPPPRKTTTRSWITIFPMRIKIRR